MASISGSGIGFAAPMTGLAISPARIARRLALAAVAGTMLIGASPAARLDLDFANVRSAKGMLRICITTAPRNFPACKDEHHGVTRSVPAATRQLQLEGLPPGDYAVAVIHDENGNGKLDTFVGIPREGFGFSRNPPIGFGPPSFAAARFTLNAEGAAQQIRLRYLL